MQDRSPEPSQIVFPVMLQPEVYEPAHRDLPVAGHDNWGWLETFVLVQVFWGVLLFLPGSQAYRVYIRAFPYLTSLVALIACARSGSTDSVVPGARWVVLSFALLICSLVHPSTWMMAGIAQVVFQMSIAAPVFWAARVWITSERLERLLWLILAANFLGAAMGLMQVYYPERFLPPEFSALAMRLNPDFVMALSYVGTEGRTIIRPPGLSDLPGGAAISGTIASLIAFAFAVRSGDSYWKRLFYLAAAIIGITVIYLTQVRSMLVMMILCMLALAAVRFRQGHTVQSGWIAGAVGVVVLGSFIWAVTLGGDVVRERFLGIVDTGIVQSYQANRGFFLDYTVRELLFEYPFGAGMGRWGMMSVYFGEPGNWQFPSLHAEIQPTGWLFDGGILMWICYGGALLLAMRNSYRVAIDNGHPLHDLASIIFVLQLLIAGLCFTGPIFNTQIGILFWLATAVLFGAQRTEYVKELIALEEESA